MVRIEFNRLRFLVIDDNAHMRRMLRTLLHGFGAREVHEACLLYTSPSPRDS